MNHTQKHAQENKLSRRVLNMTMTPEGEHKIHIEIGNSDRQELSYYFIKNADYNQAVESAIDNATERFLGIKPVVAETIAAKVEQVVAEPVVVKEERKTRKKKETKSEEMIDVPSPFTSTPQESEEKTQQVKGYESYDRNDATSKAKFAVAVTRLYAGSKEWKKHPKLTDISVALNGVPFINEKDGSVHPLFEQKAKTLFGI